MTQVEEMRKYLNGLDKAQNEEDRYWESEFNGFGLGSKKYEMMVEKLNLCGPRNL